LPNIWNGYCHRACLKAKRRIYIKFSMDGAKMTNRGRHKEEAVGMEIIVPGDSLSMLKSPDNCHQVGLGIIKEDYDQ